MTLGLTNGTSYEGLAFSSDGIVVHSAQVYGANVGSPQASTRTGGSAGVTTDPTKSGLIATFSGLTLGTVASEKLGNFYIHY